MMGNTSVVVYTSNNSGGDWWLSDEDWLALEKAGWVVEWVRDNLSEFPFIKNDRWLGALARSAHRESLTLYEAIEEWEGITGQNSTELGCRCCGQPHKFWTRQE